MTPLSDYERYREDRYFGSLNGLRFICIVAVLWHHAPVWRTFESAPTILARGFVGVDFFFVLSGYLITMLLLREEDENGTISLSRFYWRRLLRIAPPFLLTVGAISCYWMVIKGRWEYLELVPYYLFFLSNFLTDDIPMLAVTWSLAVEEQFYLIWPLILLLTVAAARRRVALLIVAIALNVAAITLSAALQAPAPEIGPLTLRLPAATYAPLLIGALLALLLHHRQSFDSLAQILGRSLAAPLLACILVLVLAWLPADLRGWPNLVMHLLMAALIGALVVSRDTLLHRLLQIDVLARIGTISYGIYLYHLVALHVTVTLTGAFGLSSAWVDLIGMTLLSIVFAEISYRTVEKYFLDKRFAPPIWSRSRRSELRLKTGAERTGAAASR